ncbi:Metallo-dependent hydrolase [Guyanagaster necrorhizus]|uniref:Metallo-dependent hydrolase n=1 Tax=Guyanagaster necrorhizus TaxID=856835 RepID=A0A9P7VFT8_9AGAR|nr:Metallo-dependent hydrolase [Guyanagaster necrorhizus MCA 3950]KAG7439765.1 Metallo-dependent hydrolase [Guyanagaster necrorhizus MCA 3950]
MSRNNRYRGSSNRVIQPLPSHDTLTYAFPSHPSLSSSTIVDTHTHLVLAFAAYRSKYPSGWYSNIFELEQLGGVNYWFVIGVHPYVFLAFPCSEDAEHHCSIAALSHPLCVGLGEIGLDYHYNRSPHAVQKTESLTIHTRKAEEHTEQIMKEVIPKDHPAHVHCFTDSPAFALRLLSHFPNLHIGITGVLTFSTNLNTASDVLETDAPCMVPHSLMIPFTAQYVVSVLGDRRDTKGVLAAGREGARRIYGV